MRLAVRMLAHRPAAVLATFVACLLAAGLATACGILLESGLRYHGAVARYAAAPVVVAAPELRHVHREDDKDKTEYASLDVPRSLPSALLAQLRSRPEVHAVVPDAAAPARVQGRSAVVALDLHRWGAVTLGHAELTAGHAPRPGRYVVLDRTTATRAGVGVGDEVRVWTASGRTTVTVTGIVAGSPGSTAYVAAGSDLLRSSAQILGVLPRTGVSTERLAGAVRAVVARYPAADTGVPVQVLAGAERGRAETAGVANTRAQLIAMSAAFGGSSLLVAGLVIANTVGLSARQRLRDIALLRAVAATPGQVRRMIAGEAFVVAALAACLGVLLGRNAAGRLRDGFVEHGVAPAEFAVRVSWLPQLIAMCATVLVAVVAAWVAGLRPSRITPTAAMTESTAERTRPGVLRLVLGTVSVAGGVTVCIVAGTIPAAAEPVAIATIALGVLSVAFLGPFLLRLVAATVGRVAGLAGEPARLAAATVAAGARRTTPVLTCLALALALVGGLWFVFTSASRTASDQVNDGLRADAVVVGPGIPADAARRLRAVDGIAVVTQVVRGTVLTADGDDIDERSVEGVTARGLAQTLDLKVVAGEMRELHGDEVAVDRRAASDLDLRVGSRLQTHLDDGTPTTLRVVALYDRGLGFADLTMSHDTLAPHAGDGSDDSLLLAGTPAGLDRARRVLATDAPPDVRLTSGGTFRTTLGEQREANAWADQLLTIVLVGYAALAAVNTLVVHTLARRREFGVLRLSGATRGQLRRSLAVEQALLLGTALVSGGGIAAAALLPSVHAITGSVQPYLPPAGLVAVLAALVVGTAVAVAGPAFRAMRGRAVEAAVARE